MYTEVLWLLGILSPLTPKLFRNKALCTSVASFLQAGDYFKIKTNNKKTVAKTQNNIKSKLAELMREIKEKKFLANLKPYLT